VVIPSEARAPERRSRAVEGPCVPPREAAPPLSRLLRQGGDFDVPPFAVSQGFVPPTSVVIPSAARNLLFGNHPSHFARHPSPRLSFQNVPSRSQALSLRRPRRLH